MADSSSFTSTTGGSAPPGTLAYQGVQSWQNSLNQYERSIQNLLGQGGQSAVSTGTGLTASGTVALQPALNYWTGILSGNPADVASAAQPQITASNQQFGAQRRVLDQYTPMGGGRSQSLANLNTTQASTNAGIISNTRASAAPALAQTALGEQGVGIQQQNTGVTELSTALNSLLQRAGLDIQGGTAATMSQIMQGIGAII